MPLTDLGLWILGALLTVNLAALGVIGRFIKETYDIATDLDVLLNGPNREQKGFVQQSREAHEDLYATQKAMHQRTEVQARLVEQMAYSMTELAEAIDEMNGHDVDVDRLEQKLDDFRDERRDHGDD